MRVTTSRLSHDSLKKAETPTSAIALAERRRPGFDQRAQRQKRRRVGDAIDPRLPEMALECRNHFLRGVVIAPGFR